MNTRLLVFAVIVIVVGASFESSAVLIFGLILLLPAFLIPSKPSSQPRTQQRKEEPPRVAQPSAPPPARVAPPPSPAPAIPAAMEIPYVPMSAQPSSSMALFPSAMFPTLSLLPHVPEPMGRARHEAVEARDELLELVLLFAIIKTLGG